MKYAICTVALKTKISGNDVHSDVNHSLGFVNAESPAEALKKADLIALQLFPVSEGWENHHSLARTVTEPTVEPGQAHIEPPTT